MQVIPVLGGRYRLGPEIGSGGMGAVHRAWDERFGREVAIKVLRAGSDEVERERLRREAQFLAHLDHVNLVAVFDAGSDRLRSRDARETAWFAMELVQGPDLRTVVRQDGPQDGPTVRRILAGLLAGLDALHAAGLVHRDLKPANVLLTAEPATGRWDVKLVDLGIAQHIRTDHLTSTGQIVGTAAYLSPEQVSGRRIGPETDVYALGLVAIEAITARIAFPGQPAESAAARLVRAPDLPADLDPSWRRVLSAMTALDPANRPPVRELLALVERLPDELHGGDQEAVTTAMMTAVLAPALRTAGAPALAATAGRRSLREPRRNRRHLLVAAFLLLVLTAAGGWIAALTGGSGPTADAVPVHAPSSAHATTPAPRATVRPAAVARTPSPTVTAPVEHPAVATPAKAEQVVQDARKRWQQRVRAWFQHRHPHG